MEAGPIIKKFRQARGLTQQELADLVGSKRESISQYESGKIDPPTKTYLKILKELRVKGFENAEDLNFLNKHEKEMTENGVSKSTARKIVEQLLEDNDAMKNMIMTLREKIVALETEKNTFERMYNKILEKLEKPVDR